MEKTAKLVILLREVESLLEIEGKNRSAEWIGDICDSISLGDLSSIDELKRNIGGTGGFWEASNDKKFGGVIERIGELLDDLVF